MIPLKLKSNLRKQEVLDEFYKENFENFNDDFTSCLDDFCKHIKIDNYNEKLSFKSIIKADFLTLVKIVKYLKENEHIYNQTYFEIYFSKYLSINKDNNNKKHDFKKLLAEKIYAKLTPSKKLKFYNYFDSEVCPYCNRNWITSFKKRNTCQLDHFFSKIEYPILAGSFFNLVPVCYSCNNIKSDSGVMQKSPHDNYNINDIFEFENANLLQNYIHTNNQANIKPKYLDNEEILKGNFEVLELDKLYSYHNDLCQEIIQKEKIYKKIYQENICKDFPDLFTSEFNFKEVHYGNYLDEKSFSKRPLSKLTSDLVRQIESLDK